MTFTHALSTNNYGPSKFIVSASAANGTHTTIQAAITAASSGDDVFIREGSYTENLTLKAGVNLTAYAGDNNTPNVTIIGKMTFTGAGTVAVSNLFLQTNSDFILAVTGSAASVMVFNNCFLNMTNNTGISYTTSSSSSVITFQNCGGNLGTTGIAVYSLTGNGTLGFGQCGFSNTGASTTQSTNSSGVVNITISNWNAPISVTSTGALRITYTSMDTTALNVTALTINGTGLTYFMWYNTFYTGTATSIVITAGTLKLFFSDIHNTSGAAISGAGTLDYAFLSLFGSPAITVTTQTPSNAGTFTPTVVGGSTTGTTTYSAQVGNYVLSGNGSVTIWGTITITAATGTGNATFGGFPFTIKNIANYIPVGTANSSSGTWTWPASTTQLTIQGAANATTAVFSAQGSAATGTLQMNNSSATFAYSLNYLI